MTRVGIAGLGLIGGSLLRGLSEHAPSFDLIGYDPSPEVERAAREAGFRTAPSVNALAGECDLALVAVPPARTPELAAALLGSSPTLIVADSASVKAAVLQELEAIAGADALRRFVPAHPLAGAEGAGWKASDPHLLMDAVWALCPPVAQAPAEPMTLFSQVVDELSGRILVCTAADHDQAVARTSHVPHVAAQALAQLVATAEPRLRAALSGGGYRDMTRVAASAPGLWLEILRANRAASLEALDELVADLTRTRQALVEDDGEALEATWLRGASLRRLVDEIRWREPAWEAASSPWPCWDELVSLGRQGRALRRLRLDGDSTLTYEAARGTAPPERGA
ncbi:MAG: prephenate dehydrogenase/arogenate dehydrogenase family protein [Thermoleophilaceae bacterium]